MTFTFSPAGGPITQTFPLQVGNTAKHALQNRSTYHKGEKTLLKVKEISHLHKKGGD